LFPLDLVTLITARVGWVNIDTLFEFEKLLIFAGS
jgi:hypothetical protein